jgi:hypothetical protein
MEKNSCENYKEEDEIERLKLILDKHWNSIIQNNITEEILLMSEELDRLIVSHYQKYISDDEIR